jgi:hypothetical protein
MKHLAKIQAEFLKQATQQTPKCSETRKTVIEYFSNPNSKFDDPSIHAFADSKGIEHSKFEEEIYTTLSSFLGQGKYQQALKNGKTVEFSPEQLRKGIEVEMEHTDCPLLAERISKDHLTEFDDYYIPRLEDMEEEAKSQQ